MERIKTNRLVRVRGGALPGAVRWTGVGTVMALLCGCSLFAYTNVPRAVEANDPVPQGRCEYNDPSPATSQYQGRATFNVKLDRSNLNNPRTLFILALSGGGSRAAYFSASVMLKLQSVYQSEGVDLLSQVSAISSVSGGSLAAAYYAISTDDGGGGNPWRADKVRALMQKDYTMRWFGNWFWPDNIAKFWATSYNRTDIMARTLAKSLYSNAIYQDLKIGNLRGDRPYLILNSTNGTEGEFDQLFTFTNENFSAIGSDVDAYSLSRAVMGTAAFPGVFNYMTLRDWSSADPKKRFIHIFDGGNYDNLGLTSACKVLDRMKANDIPYDNLVVILVDAYTDPRGVDPSQANPRHMFDYVIDTNFLAATDALLHLNRENLLQAFEDRFRDRYEKEDPDLEQHEVYYHIKFSDLVNLDDTDTGRQRLSKNLNQIPAKELGIALGQIPNAELAAQLNRIPTNFKIETEDAAAIDEAVNRLLTPENDCLKAIKQLLSPGVQPGAHDLSDPVCSFPAIKTSSQISTSSQIGSVLGITGSR